MKVFELLRSPLVKIIGITVILYFALFSNKENPNSLGNRLSPAKVKEHLNEVQEKSRFIVSNVKMAQELNKEKAAQLQPTPITIDNPELGSGEDVVACGDEVGISQGVYTKDGQQLNFFNSKIFIIGSKDEDFIEKNITGMKKDGVRNINIPYGSQPDDKKLQELLKFNATDLKYQITILSLKKKASPTATCN